MDADHPANGVLIASRSTYYLRRWQSEGVWERVQYHLVARDRERGGREASPSVAVLDSQSVRTADQRGGPRGFDAAKKIWERKRHALTDTDGRLLAVPPGAGNCANEVHAADVQDRDSAYGVLARSRRRWPVLERVFADAGYTGRLVDRVAATLPLVLDIVRRPRGATSFVILPRRWVIERAFAWTIKHRRLIHDHEGRLDVAETMITIAAAVTRLRRVT